METDGSENRQSSLEGIFKFKVKAVRADQE